MLSHLHHQFDVADGKCDRSKYKLVNLPDSCRLDSALATKLQAYLAAGRSLILSHKSGLDEVCPDFALQDAGLQCEGPWDHEVQHFQLSSGASEDIPRMVHRAYESGLAIRALPGTSALARIWNCYFDRDYRHFQVEQTPFSTSTEYVAVARRGRVIYVAQPIFRSYARFAYPVYRQVVGNCIRRLLSQPLVKTDVPTTARVTVTEQPGRRVVHVLQYIPERCGNELDVVEDVIPLLNLKLFLPRETCPVQIYLAPQRKVLSFGFSDGYVEVTVPIIRGHQMVVFESARSD